MIVVAATFVAEPLAPPLKWLLGELELDGELVFAPYNQIFQQLLDPASELRRNRGGTNVLLVRFEDFLRNLPGTELGPQVVEQSAREFTDAFLVFAAESKGSTVVALLSAGSTIPIECARAIQTCNDRLFARVQGFNGIQLLTEGEVAEVSGADKYDPIRDQLAHIPYTEAYFAALALVVARKIHAARVVPAKVLVLDCDNTLWRGVVGEDGVEGVQISEPFAALQEFAIEQHAKGILLCLVSKNVESDVLEVFQRTDMRLGKHHVVAQRINWEPKPGNIRSLAAELNLGLEAFVFLDDSPVECAQMRAELPQVVTIQVPVETELPGFLRRLWNFDKLTVTAEDTVRTQMYLENAARRSMESSAADIGQFIASLELKIDIATPTDEEWSRVEQLTQRTNQFNFTTRRRSTEELKALLHDGSHVLRVRVSDRFGDYGIVGCLIATIGDGELLVDSFLLSCRVLGRGVEHAMLRKLGELAQGAQLPALTLQYFATARNVPARAFIESVASEYGHPVSGGTLYRMPAALASHTVHKPGHDPVEIIEAQLASEKKSLNVAAVAGSGRSGFYSRIAHTLISGDSVLREIAARPRRSRHVPGEVVEAASPLEVELLDLWEDLLQIEVIGVEDNFFDLGGTSLLSVRLFAEIARRYDVQLRLTAILKVPTVRSLARLVGSSGVAHQGGLVCLRRGGGRNLFLMHDGLGETLLYLNFAKRLPASVTVYGIEPRQLPGIPLAHLTIEDMAEHYVGRIRQIQPEGPYVLGGMCAGGVIAYEMATRLVEAGQNVEAVIVLDGAAPQAAKRSGVATRTRLSRFKEAITQVQLDKSSVFHRLGAVLSTAASKVARTAAYEIASRVKRLSIKLRFLVLKYLMRRQSPWPGWLRELSVLEIYNVIESRYKPRVLENVPVILVRASVGDGSDTPHREIYRNEDFGWGDVADKVELMDVAGGHSSMLQEHAVDGLVSEILRRIPALAGMPSAPESGDERGTG
jgi:FkbH-like protein